MHNTLFDHNNRAKSKYAKKKEKERAGEKERKKNRKEVKKNRKTDSKEMCKTFLVFFFDSMRLQKTLTLYSSHPLTESTVIATRMGRTKKKSNTY